MFQLRPGRSADLKLHISLIEPLEGRLLLAHEVATATYLGGSGGEQVRDVALDGSGNAYVVGGTNSGDFATTPGAYDRGHNGTMDAFVAKFSPSGQLLWATYLGGGNYDRAYAVEVDETGVYVAGRAGAAFPTTAGSLQPAFAGDSNPNAIYGQQDGFITKLSLDGSSVLWSTYFGDGSRGFIRDIDVDASGQVVLAFTESEARVAHVTPGAYQTSRGGGKDGVIAQVSADGSAVVWASYLGGSGDDLLPPSVRVDQDGYVYVVGTTNSADLTTTAGAYDRTHNGGDDLMLAKFKPDGSGLVYLTYLGGSGDDFTETHELAVTADGVAVVASTTTSSNFPTTAGAFDRTYNGSGGSGSGAGTNYPGDGFVAKISADGTKLLASTFIGGSAGEGIEGVGLDAAGNVYFSGATFSMGLPTSADAYQRNHGGGGLDGFAGVLSGDLAQLLYLTYLGGSGADATRSLAVMPDGTFAVGGELNSSDFPTKNPQQATRSGPTDGSFAIFASKRPAEIRVRHSDVEMTDGADTISFGSSRPGSAAPEITFTIENTGGEPLSIGQLALDDNIGFEIVQQPEATVAPGGSTSFVLRMLTATVGATSAEVTFGNNDADENPFNFKVAGEVTPVPQEIADGSTTPVSFGTVVAGSAAPELTFTILNTGGQGLSIGAVELLEAVGFEIVQQPQGTVAPGASTTFVLRMLTDTPGDASATVSFTNGDADEDPFTFAVAGTVVVAPVPPEIAVTQGGTDVQDGGLVPVSFGSMPSGASPVELTFTISNTGEEPLTLGTLTLEENDGFEIVQPPADTVAPGSSTTFVLRMLTAAPGDKLARVSLATNDADENPFDFMVAGTVTAHPQEIEVRRSGTEIADGSTTPVSFGSVQQGPAPVDVTFTIANLGGQPLSIGEVVLANNAGFTVAQQPASTPLAPGATTTFVLRMLATTPGSTSADVSFANDDADEGPFEFKVAGTVTAPPQEIEVSLGTATISDGATTPVSFGSVQQGQAAPRMTFTVNNPGGQTLTLGSVNLLNNSGFAVVTQPASSVAPGGSTNFVLELTTASPGSMSADVSFTNDDADENPFDFPIVGTVVPPANLAVNGTADDDAVYVKRSGDQVHVWLNADEETAPPTHTATLADLEAFTISTGDGDDRITLDFSAGDPLPTSGLELAGDAGADELTIIGTPGDDAIAFDGSSLTLDAAAVSIQDLETVVVSASGGADALTFTANAVVSLSGAHSLESLTLGGSARLDLAGGPLTTRALAIAGQSVLDLHDNELIVITTPETKDALVATLTAAIRSARAGDPRWSGPGVTSRPAQSESLTGLAMFSGQPGADSILVKRTYNGDANLDGKVNADDYFRIDSGFLEQPANPAYTQGDFNYDGKINADDYFLIDSAFLGQQAPLSATTPVSGALATSNATQAVSAEPGQTIVRKRPVRPVFSDQPVSILGHARRAGIARRR